MPALVINTTVAAETGHNCSANPAYNKSNFPANFTGFTKLTVSGGLSTVNSSLMDDSWNPVTPFHVSNVDIHTMFPGWYGPIREHTVPWFGQSNHADIGLNYNTTTWANARVADMKRRGITGTIINWYGSGRFEDYVTLKLQTAIAAAGGFDFIIQIDPSVYSTQAQLQSLLTYCETQYLTDSHYAKQGGKPIIQFFGPLILTDAQYTAAKAAQSIACHWVFEGTGTLSKTYVDGWFAWQNPWSTGIPTDRYNLNGISGDMTTVHSSTKTSTPGVGAKFNGYVTGVKEGGYKEGYVIPSDYGQCFISQCATVVANYPTNMIGIQIITGTDLEEGTYLESGIDNFLTVSASISANIISWSVSGGTGDERTLDHYQILIADSTGAAGYFTQAIGGSRTFDLSTVTGYTAGTATVYIVAVGKPYMKCYKSAGLTYHPIGTSAKLYVFGAPNTGGGALLSTIYSNADGGVVIIPWSADANPTGGGWDTSSGSASAGYNFTNFDIRINNQLSAGALRLVILLDPISFGPANSYTPDYVFTTGYATAVSSPTGQQYTGASTGYPGAGTITPNTCAQGVDNTAFPVAFQTPFKTAWKNAVIAAINHMKVQSYASKIDYIRVGGGAGAEWLPYSTTALITQCSPATMAGLQTAWTNYMSYIQSAIVAAASGFAFGQSTNGGLAAPFNIPYSFADAEAALAVTNGFGVGNQGLQNNDISTYTSHGTASGASATNGFSSNDFLANFAAGGAPFYECQTYAASDPTYVGVPPRNTMGSLVPLLPFAMSHGANRFELYYADWQVAFDVTNTNYATYGAGYRAAFATARSSGGGGGTGGGGIVHSYSDFFLNSSSSIVQLELIELTHPLFSQNYYIVRNAIAGVTVTLEDTSIQTFLYYPLQIVPSGSYNDLDQSLQVTFGDLGQVLPTEIDRLLALVGGIPGTSTKPKLIYRTYRSDDLSGPLSGPFAFDVINVAFKKEGATLQCTSPRLNLVATGETYSLDRFPMLRGFL